MYLFYLGDNYFTILWWFGPYIDMNQPQVYMCSPSPKPPATSLHPIPLGCPRALTLGAQLHAFNWRTIALQSCVGFAIQQRESAMCLHVSPPSWTSFHPPSYPTPLGRHGAWGWAPCVYSGSPLAICFTYGSVYVSMLLSQFVPPSPSSAVSTSLFSMSASLCLPCK